MDTAEQTSPQTRPLTVASAFICIHLRPHSLRALRLCGEPFFTMAESETHPDALVTLVEAQSEFEANLIVTTLADAGIKAFAFGALRHSLPFQSGFTRVPVQVRAADLERAREALDERIADSVDLDWNEVDVGEREDNLPLRKPGRMPWPARIAFVVAIVMVVLMLLAFLMYGWQPYPGP